MNELDQALAQFHETGFEYGGGLTNHGPMAAEALEALGHESLIPPFVDVYLPQLAGRAEGTPIEPATWSASLGNQADGDWAATFEALFQAEPIGDVLTAWLPRLLPGLFAAAVHGALRTAHAARGLARAPSPLRERELALGLAYWASHHQLLPGEPGAAPEPGCGPARVLEALEPVPEEARCGSFFTDAVRVLDGRDEFAATIARLDVSAQSVDAALCELTACAAGLYLAHPELRIVYAHCITGPSALRLLAEHLEDEDLRVALGHAVQTVAALHATHALREPEAAESPDAAVLELAETPAEIRYRAACSGQEHAIKLAEACLREDAIRPDSRLRLAAADAALNLQG